MEEHGVTQTVWIILKGYTPLRLRLLQIAQRLEAAIGNGLVAERPEALAGLQLR